MKRPPTTDRRPLSVSLSPASRSPCPLLILAIYTFLTPLLTYPLIFNLTTTVPNDIGDPLLNAWILAWDSHALLTDPLNLFNANIFHPLPNTLAYSEHLFSTALVALPVQLISGEPILAYNLSLLVTFPLAGFGMYLLVLRWTRRRGAAFIAGLIFAFNPYRLAAIAHLQLLTFQWLPFAILFLDKIIASRRVRESANPANPAGTRLPGTRRQGHISKQAQSKPRSMANDAPPLCSPAPPPLARRPPALLHLYIGLATFILLQTLASWYLALYTLLIAGLYLLTALLARRLVPSRLPLLISTLLISMLLTVPFILPYLPLIDDLRQARPLSLALSLAAAPTDFAAAAPFNRLFGPLAGSFRNRPAFTEENELFVGLVATLLALVALLTWLKDCLLRMAYSILGSNQYSIALQYLRYPREYGRKKIWGDTPSTSLRTGPHTPRPAARYAIRPTLRAPRSTFYVLLITLTVSLLLTFPTPYATLASLFPLSTIIRVPARWIIPALFALSGLAGFGYAVIRDQVSGVRCQVSGVRFYVIRLTCHVSRVTRHAPPITHHALHLPPFTILLTSLLLIAESLSIPLPLAPVENHGTLDPAYHWLAGQPGDFALVELPLHSAPAPEFPEVKRLYASTLGWWRLVNGYSGYTPPRQFQLAQALIDFPNERSISALQTLAYNLQNLKSKIQNPKSLFLLVHPGEAPLDRTQWETAGRWQAERNPALRPLGQFDGDYLYQIIPPDPQRFAAQPLATFGQNQSIRLLAINRGLLPTGHHAPRIILYWQPTTTLPADYTVFIHLRAPDGFVRSQADGPPVGGHYLTSAWQPGEIIQDIHPLPNGDFTGVDHLAIGLYDPVTGERLAAFGPDGARLAEDAMIIRRVEGQGSRGAEGQGRR